MLRLNDMYFRLNVVVSVLVRLLYIFSVLRKARTATKNPVNLMFSSETSVVELLPVLSKMRSTGKNTYHLNDLVCEVKSVKEVQSSVSHM